MENKPGIAVEAENVLKECVKLTSNITSKKNNREQRRNEEKSSEYSLKFLNNFSTPEEKITALAKKYHDQLDENKRCQMFSKQWEKKYVLMQREKDQIQSEHNKTILLKSKLENLCRELQKQIKVVKEESILKNKEEEDKRKETLAMFQNSISELTLAVQHNNEKNTKLRDANIDMKEKFKSVMEQYELREHQVDKITKQMAIEAQLSEAKLAKLNLEAQAEKEKLLSEKKQLLVELTQYQARCNDLQATEVALRSQIAMYTDKYDEFQIALTKSSEVFGGFKGEMEKMSKKVEKQQREAIAWKQRWEKSHATLLEMVADRQKLDSTFTIQSKQLAQLQKLCRTMQAERTVLLNTLKENNIETPPLPQLPPEPVKPVIEPPVDRVDIMAANCAQLKHSLSQLQGQLNDLTSKKKSENVIVNTLSDAAKKSKKNKNKKNKSAKASEASNDSVETSNESTISEEKNICNAEEVSTIEHNDELPEDSQECHLINSLSEEVSISNNVNINNDVCTEIVDDSVEDVIANDEQLKEPDVKSEGIHMENCSLNVVNGHVTDVETEAVPISSVNIKEDNSVNCTTALC